MTDSDLMPFGPYEGIPLEDVPDQHLLDIETEYVQQYHSHPELREYIEDNMDAIRFNIKRMNNNPLNYNPNKNFYDE